jgi:hypothetical protein
VVARRLQRSRRPAGTAPATGRGRPPREVRTATRSTCARLFPGVVAMLSLIACGEAPSAATSVAVRCDRVASPHGSDRAAGTSRAPLRSVQALIDRLADGQTGCLRSGRYLGARPFHDAYREVRIDKRITLRSAPGHRAVVAGRMWVTRRASGARVENLFLDGTNARRLPSPTLNGDRATFRRNDVTNATGICFNLGSLDFGIATGTLLERNRIHDCGWRQSGNLDHGVYVQQAQGTVIRANWIHRNASRGVQLFPNAQSTVVIGNVIEGQADGVRFAGVDGFASSDNVVRSNVIADNRGYEVDTWWPDDIGTGNLVEGNCIGGTIERAPGFQQARNRFARLRFVSARDGDLRLRRDGSCPGVLPRGAARCPGPLLTRRGRTQEPRAQCRSPDPRRARTAHVKVVP